MRESTLKKIESTCCGAEMTALDVGTILNKGKCYCLGLCPACWCYCSVRESGRERSKIFHAAQKLLCNIKKGIIITIDIIFLLPPFLLVLMITHVMRIDDKITLIPISRTRSDLSIRR